jgi:hypothetical protein
MTSNSLDVPRALISTALFLALTGAAIAQNDEIEEIEVKVLEIKGSVESKVPGKKNKWKEVEAGDILKRGTMIQTGIKSGALLQFGEETKVLVRSSTFAVINEAFARKNEVKGEVRVDVGSVHVEAEKKRGKKLDFKVSTPQGTAAIRGTRLSVRTTDVGMHTFCETGTVHLHPPMGPMLPLGPGKGVHGPTSGRSLGWGQDHAGPPKMAGDNADSFDGMPGDHSWTHHAFHPAFEHNIHGRRFHPFKAKLIHPGGNTTFFILSPFHRWRFDDTGNYFLVKGLTPASQVLQPGGTNDWRLRVHGRDVWTLNEALISTPPNPFDLEDVNSLKRWRYNPFTSNWMLR